MPKAPWVDWSTEYMGTLHIGRLSCILCRLLLSRQKAWSVISPWQIELLVNLLELDVRCRIRTYSLDPLSATKLFCLLVSKGGRLIYRTSMRMKLVN